ncbi:hypothetical protein [Haloarcula laminariae]|uniref:hypothetical protein n=1 Tax=Haloarcula laminariae TaxID=2961577 RepID=UPI002405EE92|nr:hypothetical protein [Halomicroarcula sp. FL173]
MTSSDSDDLSPSDWNYRNDSRNEPDKAVAIVSLLSVGVGILLSFWFSFSGNPLLGLVVLVLGVVLPLTLTEYGREELRRAKEQYKAGKKESYSQPKQNTQSVSKQICKQCGWQNPRSNNYCIDCGEELGGSSSE